MKLILQLLAILQVTLKRMWAHLGMTLATLLGLSVSVALIMLVPLYADAVNFRILEDELIQQGDDRRPPWAFMYNYIGAWDGPIEWGDAQPVTDRLFENAGEDLGMPLQFAVRHLQSPTFQIFPADSTEYNSKLDLGFANLVTTTEIENHINIIEGAFPNRSTSADGPIQVLITQPFADELGWQVGETYLILNRQDKTQQQLFTIEVSGIWTAINPNDPFWFYTPSTFDELFIVHEETFRGALAQEIDKEIGFALWYIVMDGSRIGTSEVNALIGRSAGLQQSLDNLLPGIKTFIDPTDALRTYRRSVSELAIMLYTFDVAPIWLVLTFIGLVVGLAVNQQKNEIAVMRSRGSTPSQILGMATLEAILLGVSAFILGGLLSLYLTQLVARSRSFLDFSSADLVRINLNSAALYAGLFAVVLAFFTRIVPVISASQHTIITFKQEQSRALARPWWQRAWLDIILLAVTGYGFYILQQQGSIARVRAETGVADPFQNPLLILLPALAIFACTLLFLRLLPWAMQGVGWLLTPTNSVSLIQAVRYLARTPHHYRPPLSLLIMTVGLATFTASLARTVDLQLYDQAFYETGAELNMITLPRPPAFGAPEPEEQSSFTFLPISDYESIEGIHRAARVGTYSMATQVSGEFFYGDFMGVDPADFRDVAYWRWDFSRYRLGSLMNALGNREEGVLVSENLIQETSLRVGDPIRYRLNLGDGEVEFEGLIVGTFNHFPTWYRTNSPYLLVGNLNTVFEQAGGENPYRVWAQADPHLNRDQLRIALNEKQLFNTNWKEPRTEIAEEQATPARQGLFGILSVGFITSALLTVLGFFLYTLFSFRRRTVEMGVLRAVGISRGSMVAIVAWELALLILSGLILGTILGVIVSQQFIPFLQLSGQAVSPPYLVEIAWEAISQIYFLFGMLFLLALTVLSWRLLNLKVFESIKMGETV